VVVGRHRGECTSGATSSQSQVVDKTAASV
jgi:hypothetical protein